MHPAAPWQWIVQLGRNSSTYKLALADQLLAWADKGVDRIPLDDLAVGFRESYRRRVELGRPQQPIPARWTVVERAILQQEEAPDASLRAIREDALRGMVLQKFHNLDAGVSAPRFFEDSGESSALVLTRRMMELAELRRDILQKEVTSRWDLLEHAFSDPNPESVTANEALAAVETREMRVSLTHLVPAISAYQGNRCFYCDMPIERAAVDHVLPFSLVRHNHLWNLVLADEHCNANKSDQLPTEAMVERLVERNEALIRSMNPLRSTLIEMLGATAAQRRVNALKAYRQCQRLSPRVWGGGRADSDSMIREYSRYVSAHRL